jgi:hypothetical protein
MIFSTHRFTLDMQVAHSQIAIPVTVGDTAKTFYMSLLDGGEPFKIADGSLAVLTIKRPTGTYLQAFCPIKNNSTIVYDFMQDENTAAVEGIHDCELTLYGPTSEVVSSSWFTMVVSRRVVNGDNLNITDENRTAIDAMIGAEASRQAAEEARITAESGRASAETGRVNAEARREAYYEEVMGRINSGEIGGGSSIINAGTVILPASGWDDQFRFRVNFPGVTADPTKTHVFNSFVPGPEPEMEAARCWVRLTTQGDGFVIFEAQNKIKPTVNIGVNLIVMG